MNKTKQNDTTTKTPSTKPQNNSIKPATATELNICWCDHKSGGTVLGTDLMFTKHVLGGPKGQRSSSVSKRIHLNIINTHRKSKVNILPRTYNGKDMLTVNTGGN